MTDKHSIYSSNRHEITVYCTPALSAQEYSCKECLRLTEKKITFNEMKIVFSNRQVYCAKVPMHYAKISKSCKNDNFR